MKKQLALVVISAIVTLLSLEIFFRYYYYLWNTNQTVPFLLFQQTYPNSENLNSFIQPSKKTGILFELKNNINSAFINKPFYTNSDGLIGQINFSKQKPPNTIRIIGIGDSVTSSWGVNPDETFLSLLQAKLQKTQNNGKIEMLNFAVPGYNAAQEAQLIKIKALSYNPDLIIIFFVGNDLDLPNYIRKKIEAKSYVLYILQNIYYAFNQKETDVLGVTNYLGAQMSETPLSEYGRFLFTKETVPAQYQYMIGVNNYLNTMNQLTDYTVKKGIPVLLFMTTQIMEVENIRVSDFKQPLEKMGYYVIDGDNALNTYLKEHGLDLHNLEFLPDQHLNPLGHQVVATILDDFISTHPKIWNK